MDLILKEETEWHRVVLFNKLAEIAQNYMRRGSKVYIEGRLKTRKWQDQNSNDKYTTEIIGKELEMLDSMPNQGQQPPAPQGQPQQGGYHGQPQQAAPQQHNQSRQQGGYQGGQPLQNRGYGPATQGNQAPQQPQHIANPYRE